jgi:hypothetical protein
MTTRRKHVDTFLLTDDSVRGMINQLTTIRAKYGEDADLELPDDLEYSSLHIRIMQDVPLSPEELEVQAATAAYDEAKRVRQNEVIAALQDSDVGQRLERARNALADSLQPKKTKKVK